jgi:predicted nucleotidyltransferase component of viral defense system
MALREDRSCYASSNQNDLLISLSKNLLVRDNFFLTGGTALAVFYLHHRKSDDLDLFTCKELDLSKIDFVLQREFDKIIKTNDSQHLKSYLINEVKVEFVIDRLSLNDEKEIFKIGGQNYICIDSIRNISSNKLCTLVSRNEIKDYIDVYFLGKRGHLGNFDVIYEDSIAKDRIFEDVPTVAYKIEEGFNYIKNNYNLIPDLVLDFDRNNFEKFYIELTKKIYSIRY